MKVSIDGILGSARKLNTQKRTEDDSSEKKKAPVAADRVSIGSKVASRLDSIQRELREVQTSLTRNQIIDDGIRQLREDLGRGSQNSARIFDEVRFGPAKVLHDFVGDSVTSDILDAKQERLRSLVDGDIGRLRRLQVESENILASNMAQPAAVDSILRNIDSVFTEQGAQALERSSRLNADAVMRLIK